jgi:hypothetical protein
MKFITSTFARLVAGDEDAALIPLAAELIAMFSGVSTAVQTRVSIGGEHGPELMSPSSDCCSFVCCGIGDDTAGNQNGNCHLAQLG